MYDAEYEDIQRFQKKLAKHGITKKDLDLDMYAGLTCAEFDSIVKAAIAKKRKEDSDAKNRISSKKRNNR